MIETNVGISQIGVKVPEHYINTAEIAKARGLDPGYPAGGLGCIKARIPYDISLEELAVEAIRKIDYEDWGAAFFATESRGNLSKAMGIEILGMLGLNIVPDENTLACASLVQQTIAACRYVVIHGRPAGVVGVDRLPYRKIHPRAEVTTGCAAVAMRIEEDSKLLALDFLQYGEYAKDIDDFTIPVRTAPFPELDGPLTNPAYLYCKKRALEDWKTKNPQFSSITQEMDYFAGHCPYPKIRAYGSADLYVEETLSIEETAAMFWQHEVFGEEGRITLDDCIKNPRLWGSYKKRIDKVRKLPEFIEFYKPKVESGLDYNGEIGNSANCAVYISLIAILEKILEGQQVLITSYGSGASSQFVRGVATGSGFKSDLREQLNAGKLLSFEQYEEWLIRIFEEAQGSLIDHIRLRKEVLGPKRLKTLEKALEIALQEVRKERKEEELKEKEERKKEKV